MVVWLLKEHPKQYQIGLLNQGYGLKASLTSSASEARNATRFLWQELKKAKFSNYLRDSLNLRAWQ